MTDSGKYSRQTASAQIAAGGGVVFGVIVASHTSGTLKLWDALTATGAVIMNTYTFATGSQVIWFANPIEFYTGLFATIGGTADITVIYKNN